MKKDDVFDKLEYALEIAETFGITSIAQLKFFSLVCYKLDSEPSLFDLSNTHKNSDPLYRKYVSLMRKLSTGDPTRENDGLYLLEYKTSGHNRAVGLTVNGESLRNHLKDVL